MWQKHMKLWLAANGAGKLAGGVPGWWLHLSSSLATSDSWIIDMDEPWECLFWILACHFGDVSYPQSNPAENPWDSPLISPDVSNSWKSTIDSHTVIHDIWIHTHTYSYIHIHIIVICLCIYICMYLLKKKQHLQMISPSQKIRGELPGLPKRGEGPVLRRALGWDRCLAVQVGGGSTTGGACEDCSKSSNYMGIIIIPFS